VFYKKLSAKELLSYGTIISLINKAMNILNITFTTERVFENLTQELSFQQLYGIGVFFRVIWIIARHIKLEKYNNGSYLKGCEQLHLKSRVLWFPFELLKTDDVSSSQTCYTNFLSLTIIRVKKNLSTFFYVTSVFLRTNSRQRPFYNPIVFDF